MGASARIAVIGVGNEYRRDDGVGWAVAARLGERVRERQRPWAADTSVTLCDGDPGRLIGLWEGTELAVVVDAAHAHPGRPGRVHRLEIDHGGLGQSGSTSTHGLGLGEAVELARALDRLPGRLVVYAVEGGDSDLGTGLSAPVAAAVPQVVERIVAELDRHGRRGEGDRSGEGGHEVGSGGGR